MSEQPSVPLFALAVGAPWCALRTNPKVGASRTVHAATMEGIVARYSDSRTTVDAPCGVKVRIIDRAWPPRVSSLPDGWTRCTECHRETGSKRPAS